MGNERKELPETIRTERLLQALAIVTRIGFEQLRLMLAQRMQDNRGEVFPALVDFLDDCMKIKKHERRTQR